MIRLGTRTYRGRMRRILHARIRQRHVVSSCWKAPERLDTRCQVMAFLGAVQLAVGVCAGDCVVGYSNGVHGGNRGVCLFSLMKGTTGVENVSEI